MTGINELLRNNIIAKLREYDAYIDNELPDYITVMLANNKTMSQINQDLQLFLGDNTNRFTSWLRNVMADPESLKRGGGGGRGREGEGEVRREEHEEGEIPVAPPPVHKRKRSQNEDSDVDISRPLTRIEEGKEEEEEEEVKPPSLKFTKMRSDRYKGHEERYERREERYGRREERHGREERFGREEPRRMGIRGRPHPQRRSEGQRSRAVAREVARENTREHPTSTRDRDLRELIDDMKQSDGQHLQSSKRSEEEMEGGERAKSEEREEEEEEEEEKGEVEDEVEEDVDIDEDGDEIKSTSISSVVQLVERPQRTDEGGSRLLRRAILGLGPSSKRIKAIPTHLEGVATSGRAHKREKVIILPASVFSDHSLAAKKIFVGKKSIQKSIQKSGVISKRKKIVSSRSAMHSQDDDDDEDEDDEEEVIVEVGGVGEKEYDEDGLSEDDDAPHVPRGSVIRIVPTATSLRGGRSKEDNMDLRDIINKSREGKVEQLNPRFVVTLSGVNDLEAGHDFGEGGGRGGRLLPKAEGEVSIKNIKERLGVKVPEEEKEEVEEDTSGDIPEKCRFWPNCKNGDDCPYHHPTVPCNLFPDCKFGKKCLFVHPQCKFNSRCTRVDCPYLHTAPRHVATKPPMIPPPLSMPPMFRPLFNPSFSFGSSHRPRASRFPSKSALSWKPSPHVSERKFAAPEEQTTNFSV